MSKTANVMLRAELREAARTLVGSASELTMSSVFVAVDCDLLRGDEVSLALSFPSMFEPIALAARVVENRLPGGPGELGGVQLAFEPNAALVRLFALLDAPPAHRRFRVLVVEDNRLIRDVFAYRLSQFASAPSLIEFDFAESAEAAWAKLAEATFELVLVDHYLPAETGASLIGRMRGDRRFAKLPVVAMSVGGRAAREASLLAGADVFLDKPLVLRDLFNTMRALQQCSGARATRKILVLDDNGFVLAVTRAGLEAAGFEVATAEDLATFEAQRAAFAPDLILVDVQMPEAFGDDVAATLNDWHKVGVPILLVSSLDEGELALRARAARTGYVSKAAGMTELVRRCRELLEGPTT